MTSPITSHTPRRVQFGQPRPKIIAPLNSTPRIGTSGTSGVLNCLGASGLRTRRTQTPMQTRTNANNVPIDVMSPTMSSGTNAANAPTKPKNKKLALYGVRYFGWTSENTFGTRPSRDIEKNTRDWPISITRITDVKPNKIATVTSLASQP